MLFVVLTSIVCGFIVVFMFHVIITGTVVCVVPNSAIIIVVAFVRAAIVVVVGIVGRVIDGEFINALIIITVVIDRQ